MQDLLFLSDPRLLVNDMTSPRRRQPEPLIIPTVIEAKGADWNAATHKVFAEDAQRVLEALLAELGIAGAEAALENHGFDAKAYSYLLVPLHREASARRSRAAASVSGAS